MEYGENVLGLPTSEPHPIITGLSCSLTGETRTVLIQPETMLGRLYGREKAIERFNCSAGLNEYHRQRFVTSGLTISAVGEEGEVRGIELEGHPFFLATLYMPQLTSTPETPHPLLKAFVKAAASV